MVSGLRAQGTRCSLSTATSAATHSTQQMTASTAIVLTLLDLLPGRYGYSVVASVIRNHT